ncbi:unnamed protein product, partial [Pocillopora meandrina]
CLSLSQPLTLRKHGLCFLLSNTSQAGKGEKGDKGDPGSKGDKGDSGAASCKCPLQDPTKPSAHLEGANKRDVTYQVNKVIKDWTLSAPYSHLAGGMKYRDGKLTVPISGRYYIYEQIYYRGHRGKPVRISLLVNNKVVAMVQPPQTLRKSSFTFSTGGVFYLKAGDVITVAATSNVGIAYMYTYHSFFGAFLI